MFRQWLAQRGWGIGVGLALTMAAVALHLSGMTERLELEAFDYHVRHHSRISASEDIVHIDIGDDALDRVGSWPWPRDFQADLIRILHDLGARHIVMDIVFSEPKPAEVRLPVLDRYADIEGEIRQIGELSAENIIFPDDELAAALDSSGNVWLSLFYDDPARSSQLSPLRARVAKQLQEDPERTIADLADRLDEAPTDIEAIYAGVKRDVIQQKVTAYLEQHPDAGARETHESILTTSYDHQTADRADLLAAYHRALSLRQLWEKCPPIPDHLQGKLPRVTKLVPPIYKLTRNARGVGFVTFRPDIDGRMRHLALMMDWDGRLLEQLGFAAARDMLDIQLDEISLDHRKRLIIEQGKEHPRMEIQLTDDGQALLNWHVTEDGRWQRCFSHLPVTQLLQIRDSRQQMRENDIRRTYAMARAIQLIKDDEGFQAYRDRVNRLIELRREIRWAELQNRGEAQEIREARDEATQLDGLIQTEEEEAKDFIAQMWLAIQEMPEPEDPKTRKDVERFKAAHDLVTRRMMELERLNEKIAAAEAQQIERLRPMLEDKVCFVGYTATAVADMVSTPAYEHMPGVLVHSTLLNSMIQGQFRSWSSTPLQVGVIVLFGLFMTLGTVHRGPRESFIILIVIVLLTALLSTQMAFARRDYWMRLLLAVILTFVVWAMIVLVRYLVIDRQRRRFSKAVAQYVSPAMARRIADESDNLDLSPRAAEVTCFFSDLAGFTRISEKLGPEGTKTVLNPYLEYMSEALHRHDALINKFMGDGIFAFFNPPILACPEHAPAACESALDSRRALRELMTRYAQHPLSAHFEQLFMRIGIATGRVFVGDYGSDNKLDYTCVGDTVNLAARLESANKQFDSGTMINQSTYEAVRDHYMFRHLGALQVKGQSVAVRVYELLGRESEVDDEAKAFAEQFNRAVEAFGRREWDTARYAFEKAGAHRPDDSGIQRYLASIDLYRSQQPPEEWNGALELTEK